MTSSLKNLNPKRSTAVVSALSNRVLIPYSAEAKIKVKQLELLNQRWYVSIPIQHSDRSTLLKARPSAVLFAGFC